MPKKAAEQAPLSVEVLPAIHISPPAHRPEKLQLKENLTSATGSPSPSNDDPAVGEGCAPAKYTDTKGRAGRDIEERNRVRELPELAVRGSQPHQICSLAYKICNVVDALCFGPEIPVNTVSADALRQTHRPKGAKTLRSNER